MSKEAQIVAAVCALAATRELKARQLVPLLAQQGIEVERSALSSLLHRAKTTTPGLTVDKEGLWRFDATVRVSSEPAKSAAPSSVKNYDTSAAIRSDRASKPSSSSPKRTLPLEEHAVDGGPRPPVLKTAPPPFQSSYEQRQIIEAEATKWTLVEAGPGTGKTAVALARVAWLLDQGLPADRVLMVSFTRTAVAELRHRIELLAKDVAAVASVRITTLDSEAWNLGISFQGGSASEKLARGFDGNIDDAIELFASNDAALCEWMDHTDHVIIDEAQDLVGRRAELVFQILDHLPDRCGVTVFADPAQAIYGFTEDDGEDDEEDDSSPDLAFHEKLLKDFSGQFDVLRLTELYRSSNPTLRTVFERGRDTVMCALPAAQRLDALRTMAKTTCAPAPAIDAPEAYSPDDLLLYRRRSEVLLASSFLTTNKVPHRIRMGHASVGAQAWLACLFGDEAATVVNQGEFDRRWAPVNESPHVRGVDRTQSWKVLIRLAGFTGTEPAIDVRALRRLLARSRPPAELSQTEVGVTGPIVGTVHASKGREANRVSLMLTKVREGRPEAEVDQEARVTYVGSTRAREELLVGEGYEGYGFRKLKRGGRVYRSVRSNGNGRGRIQVELGRPGDVDELASVSRIRWSDDDVRRGQAFLARYAGEVVALKVAAASVATSDFTYLLCTQDGLPLGALTNAVNEDLFDIAKEVDKKNPRRPPMSIPHVSLIGVRTFAITDDHPRLAELHEPWATIGMFLVPVIRALTTVTLQPWTRRER